MTTEELQKEVAALRNMMGQFIDAMRHLGNRIQALEDQAAETKAERETDATNVV